MVSERGRSSYAAAVSGVGDTNSGTRTATPITPINRSPINRSPIRSNPELIPQRNPSSHPQRNFNTDELEDPLFLSSSDNPQMILVSPPLTGSSNYSAWAISMKIALEVKNKWSLVDGTTPSPEQNQPQFAAWRRCNLMICAWIFKSLHPSREEILSARWYSTNNHCLDKMIAGKPPRLIDFLLEESK